jgi:hypothetical protein
VRIASVERYRPRYAGDEIGLGFVLTVAVHAIPILLLVLRAVLPTPAEEPAKELVAKPVVAANLLRLGQPLDPSKLPDRVVPRKNLAPKPDKVVSKDPRDRTPPDAGAPPLAEDSDRLQRASKNDPFAEDGGKDRPPEGHPEGVEGGTETDPTKVRAGDMYAAKLGAFLHERWVYPTVISQAEAARLCVTMQIAIDRRMTIWHVRTEPIRKSGNDLFDDSARSMLMKLLDDRTPLPEPPRELDEAFRGRTVNIVLAGDLHGDTSRCK